MAGGSKEGFANFKPGFLGQSKKDLGLKKKDKESGQKPRQLSTGDQQLVKMGVSPKKYHEVQLDQPGSSSDSSQNLVKQEGMIGGHGTILVHDSVKYIPPEVLRTFRETNKEVAEINTNFEAAHATHLAMSKQEILQTATVALERAPAGQPKKALLLGVGNGLDTPLRELAEKFDHLTLVDLDRKSTESAIKKLPSELQKKFRLVITDITGIVGELCKEVQEKVDNSKLPRELFDTLAEKLNNIKEKVTDNIPNLGDDYAFVSSHLVLTQLGGVPSVYIKNAVESKFKMEHLDGTNHNFAMSYQNLNTSLHKEHIQYLARSVTPLGTVHLADTYVTQILNLPSKPLLTKLDPKIINPVIQTNFKSMKEPTHWFFEHTPNKQQFWVLSHSLERAN